MPDGTGVGSLGGVEIKSTWRPGERLTPWALFDLGRLAWIVEQLADDLTDEERSVVREASERMLRATARPE